jgi:hypothetical protein
MIFHIWREYYSHLTGGARDLKRWREVGDPRREMFESSCAVQDVVILLSFFHKGEFSLITSHLQQVRWLGLLIALVLVFSPLSAQAAEREAVSAQDEVIYRHLLLGQYVSQELVAGEVAGYAIYLPESGTYLVTAVSEIPETLFLTVYDEEDEIVFDGLFMDVDELELNAGVYILEVEAEEDLLLEFVMIGIIGGMSASEREPGRLYPGSFYAEDRVSEERYATFTIPALGYPQQVLLYLETGEGDDTSLSVEGEDIGYDYIYSEDTNLLTFWSEGGDYLVTVEPWQRRSEFTLIIFTSGQPRQLSLGEELEGGFVEYADKMVYTLDLDTFYTEVVIELEGGDEESPLQLQVVDRLYNTIEYFYSEEEEDGVQTVRMTDVFPGAYYVVIDRWYSESVQEYFLSTTGEAGAPLALLESGELAEGELVSGESTYYQFEVSQAGALVTVDLAFDADEVDLDLAVAIAPRNPLWSSASSSSNEQIIFMAPHTGIYYIQVYSYSGEGAYELVIEEGDQAPELFSGEVAEGSVDDDSRTLYLLEVDRPGQFLTVLLVGGDGSDLDLAVNLINQDGQLVNSLTSANPGSAEIVSQAVAPQGLYEVVVRAYGPGDDFKILVRLEDPADLE